MTKQQIISFSGRFEDEEEITFKTVHPEDEKYLQRGFENRVAVITEHPMIHYEIFYVGKSSSTTRAADSENTVFLREQHDQR